MTLDHIVMPLLGWYEKNKRDLPWRDKNNAYYTWVSEIMLQQTRVEAVKPYFEKFIRELPDLDALADCSQDRLLKLWEGLGYYNRVRNMQEAAKTVKEKYQGTLPADYEALKSLKGIGSYTAGAIASIAYGIPVPAVDGNVLRVVTRITENPDDITRQSVRKKIEEEIQTVMPKRRPGDFNQALMELGAVICIPNGSARCSECPLSSACLAFIHNNVDGYPIKSQKKTRTVEKLTVFVIQDGYGTAIRQRKATGLLAGLYELPNIPGYVKEDQALEYVKSQGLDPLFIEKLPPAKHIFSHIDWRMQAYRIRVSSLTKAENSNFIFCDREQAGQIYAIPSAFGAYTKYLKEEMK